MANIEDKVEVLLLNTIKDLGYELYDVQFVKEGKDFFLRIFIDNSVGIDLNDCEKVSNTINGLLDSADYIKEQYFLEVSSPGIERVLKKDKHLRDNFEKKVEVKLFKPINNKQKSIQGILKDFNDNFLIIEVNESDIKIERKDISIIKTVYDW